MFPRVTEWITSPTLEVDKPNCSSGLFSPIRDGWLYSFFEIAVCFPSWSTFWHPSKKERATGSSIEMPGGSYWLRSSRQSKFPSDAVFLNFRFPSDCRYLGAMRRLPDRQVSNRTFRVDFSIPTPEQFLQWIYTRTHVATCMECERWQHAWRIGLWN